MTNLAWQLYQNELAKVCDLASEAERRGDYALADKLDRTRYVANKEITNWNSSCEFDRARKHLSGINNSSSYLLE